MHLEQEEILLQKIVIYKNQRDNLQKINLKNTPSVNLIIEGVIYKGINHYIIILSFLLQLFR